MLNSLNPIFSSINKLNFAPQKASPAVGLDTPIYIKQAIARTPTKKSLSTEQKIYSLCTMGAMTMNFFGNEYEKKTFDKIGKDTKGFKDRAPIAIMNDAMNEMYKHKSLKGVGLNLDWVDENNVAQVKAKYKTIVENSIKQAEKKNLKLAKNIEKLGQKMSFYIDMTAQEKNSFFVTENNILASEKKPSAVLHELGHMINYHMLKNKNTFNFIHELPLKMCAPVAIASVLFNTVDFFKNDKKNVQHDKKENEPLKLLNKLAPKLVILGAAPLLFEEGLASLRAVKAAKQIGLKGKDITRIILPLAGGLASYAMTAFAGASILSILPSFLENQKTKMNQKNDEKSS